MKHEWRKQEKGIYLPKQTPEILTIPNYQFFMLKGRGNPNHQDFEDRLKVLYGLSYAIRMMPKQGHLPEGYFEYTVYPLEGIWDLTEKGRGQAVIDKDELIYTLMIRQPGFVTQALFEDSKKRLMKKQPSRLIDEVTFSSYEEGLVVQMMHVGPYDEEKRSFDAMKSFIQDQGLALRTLVHREIYISDARKVAPEKLQTVLRYQVERLSGKP